MGHDRHAAMLAQVDPLTEAQPRQLHDICRRIMRAIDPESHCGEH